MKFMKDDFTPFFGVEPTFYRWWVKACNNLGLKGVDLYAGSRHSSAIVLREHATPEQIKRATMHTTSKAFERYFQLSKEELREMYNCTTEKPTYRDCKRF